jgi:hypothetical protein
MLQKFGQRECQCLVIGESQPLQLGWRVFHLKAQFDEKVIQDVREVALVKAMQSSDGPLQYLKQIYGSIIKEQH